MEALYKKTKTSYVKGSNGTIGHSSARQNIFRVTLNTLDANVTIANTENSVVAGPLTISSGVYLTIETGGRVVIS